MEERVSNTSARLKEIMKERNLKQVDILELAKPVCEKYGEKLNRSNLSQYVNGTFEPSQHKLFVLANALNVSEAWLMGFDVPRERQIRLENLFVGYKKLLSDSEKFSQYEMFDNISPIRTQRIPLLGEIACGKPIYCDEDRESYVEVGADIRADFCLRAKGDSMIGARIMDGDIVFIREQPIVENGEIAAVIIDDEATLKRVYYYKDSGKLILQAENPKYSPLIYEGEELNSIRILGKAIAFESNL